MFKEKTGTLMIFFDSYKSLINAKEKCLIFKKKLLQ